MKKLGLILVISSFLFYGLLILVPFLEFSIAVKGIISTSLVICGEVSFWIGSFILGKEFIAKIKSKFNFVKLFSFKNNEKL